MCYIKQIALTNIGEQEGVKESKGAYDISFQIIHFLHRPLPREKRVLPLEKRGRGNSRIITKNKKPEYLVKRKSFCNGQDCLVTLYKQKGKTFIEVFSAQNLDIGEEFDAGGMRNLKSCAVKSNSTRGVCTYYKWDKNEYVVFKCMEAISEKSKLKAKIVPCSKVD